MDIKEYLEMAVKPEVVIGDGIYFYIGDNLFINKDFIKATEPESYVYIYEGLVSAITEHIIENEALSKIISDSEGRPEGYIHPQEYVYLMIDRRSGFYKIGISTSPKFREKTLQSQSPKIELLFAYKGTKKEEQELHKKFAHKRIRGEWFYLSYYDIKLIKTYFNKN